VNAQPLTPSLSGTGAPVMFLISMNRWRREALYITSLMTTGRRRERHLAAPGGGQGQSGEIAAAGALDIAAEAHFGIAMP